MTRGCDMTTRRSERALLKPLAVLALLAAAVLAVLALPLVGRDSGYATSFNPTAAASLADPAPNANSNIVTTFGIKAPDSNFGLVVNFIPAAFFVAADADVPNGSIGAHLSSAAVLGLINGPCQPGVLNPPFARQ